MSPLFVAVLFQTSALIGVDVVDVDKGALLRGQTVLVEGRQITAVGASAHRAKSAWVKMPPTATRSATPLRAANVRHSACACPEMSRASTFAPGMRRASPTA